MNARFSQKISGSRRAVMEAIASVTHTRVHYTKAPRFAYETGNWSIDRDGVLTSPVFGMEEGGPLFHADLMGELGRRGFQAEGLLTVSIYPDGFDAAHLANIRAVLAGKATLIRHSLGVDVKPDARLADGPVLGEYALEGGFVFPFFPAAVTLPGILSALQFASCVCALAASQKQVRTKDRPVKNEKYAMRCFLLRLGMIGRKYADARRELLSRLSGDGSFKSGSRPVKTAAAPAPPLEDRPLKTA